ncbi:hypothetical protein ACIRQP_35055 [Streptomyces sp. NPDC102274]|uniref:hypothetical protein n=1 Tax=Streptomyces sp. NPDC102274 TaxID=3366151 RepID=UPI00380E49D9
MPPPRADLSAFATALAARLPGDWTSEYHRHAAYEDQFPIIDRLWDIGHVDYIVSQYVLVHDAVLYGPDDQALYIADRPLRPRQFVVAPLEPHGDTIKPHHFVGVEEPNGIAVPNDPARAAAQLVQRLLPRYEDARRTVRHNAQRQPEPPHRKGPPQVAQVVTLTQYKDGALGAPYESVPPEAHTTLYLYGFQYLPHQAAFLLPSAYGEAGRALRVYAMAQELAARGIGVNLRHAAPSTSPALSTAPRKAAHAHHR